MSSISLVADGPATQVVGRVGFLPRMSTACGTVGWIDSRSRMMTWRSGTREMARRPWSGSPSRQIVPDSEIAVREQVTTASIPSSSSVGIEAWRESSRTVRPFLAAASL